MGIRVSSGSEKEQNNLRKSKVKLILLQMRRRKEDKQSMNVRKSITNMRLIWFVGK